MSKATLTQGRYRWRHDKVLMMLANDLEHERRKKCKSHGKLTSLIKFVRKGEKPSRTTNNFLQIAWEMKVDLGGRLQFPQIIQTTLRPDLDLWSEERTKIILTELTVPWEEGGDQALKKRVPNTKISCDNDGERMAGMAVPS